MTGLTAPGQKKKPTTISQVMTILRNVLVILAIAASADAMSSTVLPGYKTQFRVVKKGDSERFDRCILEIVINLVIDGWPNSFMPNTD